jgi:hypothetical protein
MRACVKLFLGSMLTKIRRAGTIKSMPNVLNDREQLRQWVQNWQRVGLELEEIRRREIEEVETREAIRQIFGSAEFFFRHLDAPATSGLIEQQAWFAKLRR